MLTETWIQWKPIEYLEEKYYTDYIFFDGEVFKIVLYNEKKIIITFENSVAAYKREDETLRYKLILALSEKYGGSFYGKWSLFKVENSLYVQWLSEQSGGISDDRNLIHFCILGADWIIDIASYYEPIVEIVENV